ncbi:TPA: hypothetical protein GDD11_03945 [Legionella pneumophila]|nr:hypothetical protein [Legionella pneumophila]HAT8331052.1 hypothetical protein [Legionella pneumophila]
MSEIVQVAPALMLWTSMGELFVLSIPTAVHRLPLQLVELKTPLVGRFAIVGCVQVVPASVLWNSIGGLDPVKSCPTAVHRLPLQLVE